MMYKDKEKQRQANKEAAQRRRDKAKGMTFVIPDQKGMMHYVMPISGPIGELPLLPKDEVIACNNGVHWPDILAMSKSDIDYVYECGKAVGDGILLRLRRAAGYHLRVKA